MPKEDVELGNISAKGCGMACGRGGNRHPPAESCDGELVLTGEAGFAGSVSVDEVPAL